MNHIKADRDYVIHVTDEYGFGRESEIVEFPIGIYFPPISHKKVMVVDEFSNKILSQITNINHETGTITHQSSLLFLLSTQKGCRERNLILSFSADADADNMDDGDAGIKQLVPEQSDGFRRLDTGSYILELCCGKAIGAMPGKWGLRYFDLCGGDQQPLLNYTDALGGVFGPYYTPENGLINPTQNTIAEVSVLEEGPLLCRYRFDINVPNGLDPALHNSRIEVIWNFYYKSHRFDRTYCVTDYETIIDGMKTVNKITVGDEFDGGKGNLLFSHFGAYPETIYHGGDPYWNVLREVTAEVLRSVPISTPRLKEFAEIYSSNLDEVSPNWYWKIFDPIEKVIDEKTRSIYLDKARKQAAEAVWKAVIHDGLKTTKMVDVTKEPQFSAFVRWVDKSFMKNFNNGLSVIWYTDQPIRRLQIVANPKSGWINWGTNGEKEYPELPSGTTIKLSYGRFNNWIEEAKKMESPLLARLEY